MSEGVLGMMRDPKTGKLVHWSTLIEYGTSGKEITLMTSHPLQALLHAAAIVCAQDTGDIWTDDHGWVRPIKPETINALETAVDNIHRAYVILAVADERHRQIRVEGWTPEHDDQHDDGALAMAAAAYAVESTCNNGWSVRGSWAKGVHLWPWGERFWKPKDRRRNLIRAGALIVAEIERLDRSQERQILAQCGSG